MLNNFEELKREPTAEELKAKEEEEKKKRKKEELSPERPKVKVEHNDKAFS